MTLLSELLLVPLLFPAAPVARAAPAATSAPATPGATGLDGALATVQAEEIRADVFFLADDEMRGRDTPSPELRIAARYIAARLDRLGFEPMGHDGYFFRYPLLQKRADPAACRVRVAGRDEFELRFAEDYFFHSTRDLVNHEVSGAVVFCGDGGSADLARAEPAGKWALCFDDGSPSSRRVRHVQRAGALGLILLADPDAEGDPLREEYADAVKYSLTGQISFPLDRDDDDGGRRVLPQVILAREAGRHLLAASALADEPPGTRPRLGQDLGLVVAETRVGRTTIEVENVCGLLRGEDPVLAKDVVIVSAHYDHVGVDDGEIYNGADDNASGSSGLLALAEALKSYGPLRRSVLIVWCSGEEKGLYGSKAWAQNPVLPLGFRPYCNLNIDMIGRNRPDELYVTPSRDYGQYYNGLTRLCERMAPLEGFPELGSADEYYFRSDHKEFASLGIPVAFLFNGVHEDYHRPTDTPDKIDPDKIRRVVRLVVRVIDALQVDDPGL